MRRSAFALLFAALLLASSFAPASASANGSYSHIYVSQLAVEELPNGVLRDLLRDPNYRVMYEAGSMFPDSGYAASSPYGEEAHWPPFIRAYAEWLVETYAGDFSSDAAKEHLAFYLGVASHGVADQIYDFTILKRSEEIDGDEGDIDREADYLLIAREHTMIDPEPIAPYSDLGGIFADSIAYGSSPSVDAITVETMMNGMTTMDGVIRIQDRVAYNLYLDAYETYPWLATHIVNPEATGSLPHLAKLVAAHWETAYARARGVATMDTDLFVGSIPDDGAVNFPVDPAASTAQTQIGIVFGYGIQRDQARDLIRLVDPEGTTVATTFHTPYNTSRPFFAMLRPAAALEYDTTYTVEISAGVRNLVDDESTAPTTFSFRTRCAPEALDDCPALPAPLVADPVPSEAPVRPRDAGVADAGTADAGVTPPTTTGGGCSAGAQIVGPSGSAALLFFSLLVVCRRRRSRA